MSIQSILFDRSIWTPESAINWLDSHGYAYYKIDIKTNHLRFRQFDPPKYGKYITKKIGNGIEFIILLRN